VIAREVLATRLGVDFFGRRQREAAVHDERWGESRDTAAASTTVAGATGGIHDGHTHDGGDNDGHAHDGGVHDGHAHDGHTRDDGDMYFNGDVHDVSRERIRTAAGAPPWIQRERERERARERERKQVLTTPIPWTTVRRR